ncbi:MAG: hypothetical protein GC204_15940 [Chloroflexi bacterium]|nr:hypothetical protein [Chloroflexota bacterium]
MRRISAALVLLIVGLTACGQNPSQSEAIALANPTALPTPVVAIRDTDSFADALRASGADVSQEGDVSLAFLHTRGTVLRVGDQHVQVYQYDADADARSDAARFSRDGAWVSSDIGATLINWFATPHLYQMSSLIAVYIGDQNTTLKLLESLLGAPFAGGANPYHTAHSES